MYAQYLSDCANSSIQHYKKVMAAFYTSDTLRDAKYILWSHLEENSNFLEAMQARQTRFNKI